MATPTHADANVSSTSNQSLDFLLYFRYLTFQVIWTTNHYTQMKYANFPHNPSVCNAGIPRLLRLRKGPIAGVSLVNNTTTHTGACDCSPLVSLWAQQHTLGAMEGGFLLLAGAHAPGRVGEVPLALSNEVQDCLVICIHGQALLG